MLVMSDNPQKFQRDYHANSRALRRLRTRAKLSLKALGDMADVNYTTISRIEHGHNRSSHWPTLQRLADALGVHVDKIVIYDDDPDLPAGAKNEEHLDAVLDHEEELRRRRDSGEGNGPGGSGT